MQQILPPAPKQNIENSNLLNRQIYPLHMDILIQEDDVSDLCDFYYHLTMKTKAEITNLKSLLNYFQGHTDKRNQIQGMINDKIRLWSEKVARLGGRPLSLWKVKIHTVNGVVEWEYPHTGSSNDNNNQTPPFSPHPRA